MDSWLNLGLLSCAGDVLPSSAHPMPGASSIATTTSNHHSNPPHHQERAVRSSNTQGRHSADYTSRPLSTASLSVPFSQGQSPRAPSTGATAGGFSSPMAPRHRSRSSYAGPYNPQDWGPVGSDDASDNGRLRIIPQPLNGSQSGVSSTPPPPYSPPSQRRSPEDNADQIFSTGRTIFSEAAQPYNAAGPNDVGSSSGYPHSGSRPRPHSMYLPIEAGPSSRMPHFPPPPPLPRGHSETRVPTRDNPNAQKGHRRNHSSFEVRSNPLAALLRDGVVSHNPASDGRQDIQVGSPWPATSIRPPSSRRAASAGALGANVADSPRNTSHSERTSPPMRNWEPGMPLPPPPPGPPPSTRSRSAGSLPENPPRRATQVSARRSRPPPVRGTGLDTIPPTPAGWVDEESTGTSRKQDKQPLHDDTSYHPRETDNSETKEDSITPERPPSWNLFRSLAARDPSAKGIRERRIERRNRQSQVSADFSVNSSVSGEWSQAAENVVPLDLVLPKTEDSPDRTRYPTSTRFTPCSGNSSGSDKQQACLQPRTSSTGLFSERSSLGIPNPGPKSVGICSRYAQTPPFSPSERGSPSFVCKEAPRASQIKTLPTPPPNSAQGSRPTSQLFAGEHRRASPRSDLATDVVTTGPMRLRRTSSSTQETTSFDKDTDQKKFLQSALQRHEEFIAKEAAAADDSEALTIFAEFIVTESQIRRKRYAKSWDSCSLNLEEVRRSLFELPESSTMKVETSQLTPVPYTNSSANETIMQTPQSRNEPYCWNTYKPSLSPIASLNTSNDEMSSRGRAPSRWWESKTGSSSEGYDRLIQRSKRELKYMGLPREQREAMQWEQEQAHLPKEDKSSHLVSVTQPGVYGPEQYPPEKVGWHEEEKPSCQDAISHRHFQQNATSPRMDISRFITLPPPYPRHHPAVNNSHPDLVAYRTTVRAVSDLSEVKSTRRRHQSQVEELFEEHQKRIQQSRQLFKSNVQGQIEQGNMTFAQAAEAEAALHVDERNLERELAKKELEAYQDSVLKPLHTVLVERIARTTECIDELSGKLFDDAQLGTPDQTQEEGDEKPELLEKLTQLKWLFEAREQLHCEVHNLIDDQNEKYRIMVSIPHTQNADEDSIHQANSFFLQDALDRHVNNEVEAHARLETFLDVIEQNVVRGVEVQLSAFWDIAPSLLDLIQQIPDDNLRGFQVQIPTNEYEENPSYYSHPLQYLYSLLSHAEKSTYQFIESQTNLLCLLHEVKSAVMRANTKMLEVEHIRRGEPEDVAHRTMHGFRAEEEKILTADLKDRVATIEGQWNDALGSQIQALRERVKEHLIAEGGWDDMEHLE